MTETKFLLRFMYENPKQFTVLVANFGISITIVLGIQ